MDINPFEMLGKTVRRTAETLEDSYAFSEQVFCHKFPMNLIFGRTNWVQENSTEIMTSASKALVHDDFKEASHQLNREIYFASISDELAGSPDEKAAHAGLEALKRGRNSNEILGKMVTAWQKEQARKLEE